MFRRFPYLHTSNHVAYCLNPHSSTTSCSRNKVKFFFPPLLHLQQLGPTRFSYTDPSLLQLQTRCQNRFNKSTLSFLSSLYMQSHDQHCARESIQAFALSFLKLVCTMILRWHVRGKQTAHYSSWTNVFKVICFYKWVNFSFSSILLALCLWCALQEVRHWCQTHHCSKYSVQICKGKASLSHPFLLPIHAAVLLSFKLVLCTHLFPNSMQF